MDPLHTSGTDIILRLPALFDRRSLLLGAGCLLLGVGRARAQAPVQDARYLRIATGSAAGTYFPVGDTIARLLSHPPGLPPCDAGAPCGVTGLIATAETSDGSVANVAAVSSGAVETALAQADVVAWALEGKGLFAGKPALANLRVIANLYVESMHIVVRREAGITSVPGLTGRKVSLDRPGSGTRGDALEILDAYGVKKAKLDILDLGPSQAADALNRGEIDAFFFLGGAPAANVADIAGSGDIALLPIDGPVRDKLLKAGRYFTAGTIPEGAYPGIGATPTLAVGAQWICAAELAEALVYDITKALFDPVNRPVLAEGHPKAAEITLQTATAGLAAPLHPGAVRFYREQGISLPEGAI
ncbi:TAXI family TRAP transporter solute-binding subunit [Zavarzinia sp.]|uniref:TAXI family TRAP transporter solute-binding subunit n=1 Tax=Zavarzinia sp. TaxID=2027920 RepID=UPI0035616BE0